MIKAIFFDVDGTLLSHTTKRIPADTISALSRLREKGIKIFMATGRHPVELAELPVNDLHFDGYVTLNGQLCLDNGKKPVHGTPLSPETTTALASLFREKTYPMVLIDEEKFYINFVNDTVIKAQQSISTPVPETGTYENGVVYQATVFLTKSEETLLTPHLPQGCRLTRWCEHGADIISTKGGKVDGIRYFCEVYGIGQHEIMTFGDAENDMDMLKFAQIGVAMGNATEGVRDAADYVTADIDAGGIHKALRHFQIL